VIRDFSRAKNVNIVYTLLLNRLGVESIFFEVYPLLIV
jgi:hypothetical protein